MKTAVVFMLIQIMLAKYWYSIFLCALSKWSKLDGIASIYLYNIYVYIDK